MKVCNQCGKEQPVYKIRNYIVIDERLCKCGGKYVEIDELPKFKHDYQGWIE